MAPVEHHAFVHHDGCPQAVFADVVRQRAILVGRHVGTNSAMGWVRSAGLVMRSSCSRPVLCQAPTTLVQYVASSTSGDLLPCAVLVAERCLRLLRELMAHEPWPSRGAYHSV